MLIMSQLPSPNTSRPTLISQKITTNLRNQTRDLLETIIFCYKKAKQKQNKETKI